MATTTPSTWNTAFCLSIGEYITCSPTAVIYIRYTVLNPICCGNRAAVFWHSQTSARSRFIFMIPMSKAGYAILSAMSSSVVKAAWKNWTCMPIAVTTVRLTPFLWQFQDFVFCFYILLILLDVIINIHLVHLRAKDLRSLWSNVQISPETCLGPAYSRQLGDLVNL